MTDVFIASDNIVSPIGVTSAENFTGLTENRSGVKLRNNPDMSGTPFYASLLEGDILPAADKYRYTKFEQLIIASVSGALKDSSIITGAADTVLIISSTKGNISLIEDGDITFADIQKRVALHESARIIAEHFGIINKPVVISNACISGLLALITGMRLIRSGQYKNAIVTGADVISKFVLSGFQSFQAISSEPCKPFDVTRNGITLGEGAATIILSSESKYEGGVKMSGGSVSNDANHISGPSRTGEELYDAIRKALKNAELNTSDIDFISAHGTATVYNDEMEAKAITLAGMQSVPVNSLKGYYGHTLGAAGLIESVVAVHSLKANKVLPTRGFISQGAIAPLNVCDRLITKDLKHCLKTASGFGGCNAAIVLSK